MSNELIKAESVDLAALPKITERAHHAYSPSSLAYLEACPCFQNQESATPHERTTAGTLAHGVAESGEDNDDLSDEDAALAAECIEFVAQRRAEMAAASGTISEIKEEYLPIDDRIFSDGVKSTTAGYLDHALISPDGAYAEIVDFKFGRWHVAAASENPQGIAYALGIFYRFPTVQRIKVFFKQPLIAHISEADFTRDQVPALYLRVQTIVARAREARSQSKLKDFSMARAVVGACNFCRHLGKCDAVNALALKVGAKFYPLQIPENVMPSAIHSTRDTTLAMRLSQVLGVWATAVRQVATNRVLCGDADVPEGFAIAQKSEREVVDASKYKEVALRHISPEQYANSCNVVFGRIEKCIKDAQPRGQKTAAIEAFNEQLESSGAVARGASYTFLKAVSTSDEKVL